MTDSEDLVAYCGLYCGDCFNYKGEIADLARDLRKKLRETRFDRVSLALAKVFKQFRDYQQGYEVLGAMVKMRCKRACRGGGGPPSCKIRTCCQRKDIPGCWECDQFETCPKLRQFESIHEDAFQKNLRKIEKDGIARFIEGKRCW